MLPAFGFVKLIKLRDGYGKNYGVEAVVEAQPFLAL
jgi:hypothetical protein